MYREFKGFNASHAQVKDYVRTAQPEARISAWIFVDDRDQAHSRVVKNSMPPDSAPPDQPWGGRLFHMRDPYGLMLAFVEMKGGR